MAVLLLLALFSALAAVKLAGAARHAQMGDVLDQLAYQDRLLREHARRFDRPGEMRIDLAAGSVQRAANPLQTPDGADPQSSPPMRVPDGFRIARVLSPGRDVEAGQTLVSCSGRGITPSYALLLQGSRGEREWVMFVGLTGQSVRMQNDASVHDIFDRLAAR